MSVTLNFNVCKNSYSQCPADTKDLTAYTWGTKPDWFTVVNDGTNDVFDFNFIPTETGSFTITATSGTTGVSTVNITVIDCGSGYDNCASEDDINVCWLNPAGGWSSYVFSGILVKSVDMGKASTIKSGNNTNKFYKREGVAKARTVNSGPVPKSHVDFLETLKYSIQAYLYNTATDEWDIPILIDSNSFDLYEVHDKLFEFKFSFKYAEEINIQKQ